MVIDIDKFQFAGERMKKYIANVLTACRILGSILLLFFPAFFNVACFYPILTKLRACDKIIKITL
ncbi:MAG: hypothetical protein J6V69_00590 [Clostridia bacterium]|nr:hypothetical protein [Clostridia bacterium]